MVAPLVLSDAQAAAEVESLRRDNRAVLAVPLLSEGSISPAQVGLMPASTRRAWQESAQKRLEVEARIRELSRPYAVRLQEAQESARRTIDGRLLQIERQSEMLERVGKGKSGKLRPSYRRQIEALSAEAESLREERP